MRWTNLTFLCLALLCALVETSPRVGRQSQLAIDNELEPSENEAGSDGAVREKRKLEGFTQAKFGVKNAVLGFVFGSGMLSSHLRMKRQLSTSSSNQEADQKQIGTHLQFRNTNRPSRQSIILEDIPQQDQSQNGIHLLQQQSRTRRQSKPPTSTKDDIPVFDRNKVSLDFPGDLFGPSVSLLIKTTKIVGDVIQNSAVRTQTLLRLFSPLFRGPFAIKGLEPATTTTTTTTTKAPPTKAPSTQPPSELNEV